MLTASWQVLELSFRPQHGHGHGPRTTTETEVTKQRRNDLHTCGAEPSSTTRGPMIDTPSVDAAGHAPGGFADGPVDRILGQLAQGQLVATHVRVERIVADGEQPRVGDGRGTFEVIV